MKTRRRIIPKSRRLTTKSRRLTTKSRRLTAKSRRLTEKSRRFMKKHYTIKKGGGMSTKDLINYLAKDNSPTDKFYNYIFEYITIIGDKYVKDFKKLCRDTALINDLIKIQTYSDNPKLHVISLERLNAFLYLIKTYIDLIDGYNLKTYDKTEYQIKCLDLFDFATTLDQNYINKMDNILSYSSSLNRARGEDINNYQLKLLEKINEDSVIITSDITINPYSLNYYFLHVIKADNDMLTIIPYRIVFENKVIEIPYSIVQIDSLLVDKKDIEISLNKEKEYNLELKDNTSIKIWLFKPYSTHGGNGAHSGNFYIMKLIPDYPTINDLIDKTIKKK